jgi:hypothetical protein
MATGKSSSPPESWMNHEVTISLIGSGTNVVGKLTGSQKEYYVLNQGWRELIVSKGAVETMCKSSSEEEERQTEVRGTVI